MTDIGTTATDGGDSIITNDPMEKMRNRYDRCVEAENTNRDLARDDLRFLTIPGNQWDFTQRKARESQGRACYEFPILRSHWRQVLNDQKQARPGIKIRATEDDTEDGAELRQGLIKNIESVSNADRAYDAGFELLTASGMAAWRVVTDYSTVDGWDQDIGIKPIIDPLSSVWFDPNARDPDLKDAMFAFVEETISREEFKSRYPKADPVSFESAKNYNCHTWYGEDSIRIAEYWRKEPITKTICLLSDGRSVEADQWDEIKDAEQQKGVTCTKERKIKTHKVVQSIVAGMEEIEGPSDWPGTRFPIILIYANRHYVEGRWVWCGMVRFSRDPQKLLNYNLTTAQEVISKQPKSPYIVTPKMLEGAGVKAMWDKANQSDVVYLPITADPAMPNGPIRLQPPAIASAFMEMATIATDMLKASDGIYDESQGKQTNATSGRAILARQREGDVATFDYQDTLGNGIQATGEIILELLPHVYDTPRAVRVLGKDGGENWVKLYEQVPDKRTGQMVTVNDLSNGKYDVTISSGPSYSTQRSEFVDVMMQLNQQNPMLMQIAGDLVFTAMDFPGAEQVGERLKMMLPPPIQQQLQSGKDQPPEVAQMKMQMQQMQQQAQQHIQMMQQEMQKLQAKADSKDAQMLNAQTAQASADIEWYNAHTARLAVLQKDMHAAQKVDADAAQRLDDAIQAESARVAEYNAQQTDNSHAAMSQQIDQQHEAGMQAMDQQGQQQMQGQALQAQQQLANTRFNSPPSPQAL